MANRPFNRPPTKAEQLLVDVLLDLVISTREGKSEDSSVTLVSEQLNVLGYINEIVDSRYIRLTKILHTVDKVR